MKQSVQRIKHVDYLKAIAIILVVFGHSITYYNRYHAPNFILNMTYNFIYSFHVCLFFLIAGYFCTTREGYLKERFFRILLPSYFFSILKVVYAHIISSDFSHTGTLNGDIIEALLYGQQYWFCYSLFTMYVIAFFFVKAKPKSLLIAIIAFVLLNIMFEIIGVNMTNLFQIQNTVYFIIYFLAGMVIRKRADQGYTIDMLTMDNRILIIILAISISVGFIPYFKFMEKCSFLRVILAFSMMLLVYYFSLWVENRSIKTVDCFLEVIARYTLQIMLIEPFYRVVLFKIINIFIDINAIIVFVIAIINVLVCIISCLVVEKIPVLNFVCGLKKKIVKN